MSRHLSKVNTSKRISRNIFAFIPSICMLTFNIVLDSILASGQYRSETLNLSFDICPLGVIITKLFAATQSIFVCSRFDQLFYQLRIVARIESINKTSSKYNFCKRYATQVATILTLYLLKLLCMIFVWGLSNLDAQTIVLVNVITFSTLATKFHILFYVYIPYKSC